MARHTPSRPWAPRLVAGLLAPALFVATGLLTAQPPGGTSDSKKDAGKKGEVEEGGTKVKKKVDVDDPTAAEQQAPAAETPAGLAAAAEAEPHPDVKKLFQSLADVYDVVREKNGSPTKVQPI